MTVDTLARMTQDEFSKTDEHFDAVDGRFDKVDERFDKVDQRLDRVDRHLDKIDSTLKTVLDVVLELPSKKAFERLDNKVQTFDVRLTSLERKVK